MAGRLRAHDHEKWAAHRAAQCRRKHMDLLTAWAGEIVVSEAKHETAVSLLRDHPEVAFFYAFEGQRLDIARLLFENFPSETSTEILRRPIRAELLLVGVPPNATPLLGAVLGGVETTRWAVDRGAAQGLHEKRWLRHIWYASTPSAPPDPPRLPPRPLPRMVHHHHHHLRTVRSPFHSAQALITFEGPFRSQDCKKKAQDVFRILMFEGLTMVVSGQPPHHCITKGHKDPPQQPPPPNRTKMPTTRTCRSHATPSCSRSWISSSSGARSSSMSCSAAYTAAATPNAA